MYLISYGLRMRLATILMQAFGRWSAFDLAFRLNILDNGVGQGDAVSVSCLTQKEDLRAALELLAGQAAAPEAETALQALQGEIGRVGEAVQADLDRPVARSEEACAV